jgi:hypothetical protein
MYNCLLPGMSLLSEAEMHGDYVLLIGACFGNRVWGVYKRHLNKFIRVSVWTGWCHRL